MRRETDLQIRTANHQDAAAIASIYNHFINRTTVTFEEQSVSADDLASRIEDVLAAGLPWLVACKDGVVIGYAYATRWRVRHAYRFSAESTIYMAPGHNGQGHGAALYAALIDGAARAGNHLLIGGVALPNDASVALHEKLGFRKVAQFSEVGFKFDRWIDVGYWELKLPTRLE